ncbi:cyclin-I [Etheostoma cragini]|uniref:cyclin-I n=1 Tax=Etheostoma cragini TaxID=417921 RepID=UPI00155F3E72|nr:cyclin-I [Etheostoma cragini]
MKFFEPWGRQKLSFLLEKAASRETKMWKVYVPKKPSSQDIDITPAQRDEAVRWLTELHSSLQLYPETLVLAVSILDRFLASIKARPKYLRCIAIACFFLAAKTCEEDERVPSLKEMAASSSCGCSPSEILRMERIILDKLNWDLHTATALDFLHIFHAMVLSCRSGFLNSMLGLNRSQHLTLLTWQLYNCLADHTLIQLRGSMLALALITLELETCCPDWLALTIDLLRKAQIDSSELIRSRELVARSLSTRRSSLPPNTVYIYQPLQSQTTLQPPDQDPTLPCCTMGIITSTTETSGDHALVTAIPAQLQTPADGEDGSQQPWSTISSTNSSIPVLLSPPKHHHLNHLQKVTLRCKASTKRKVDEMEVDDFYDAIKRLYNEDVTTSAAVQEGGTSLMGAITTSGGGGGGGGGGDEGLGVCSVLLSRQEGSSSPCPPLQPVRAS